MAFAAFAASSSSPTCRPVLVQPAPGAILDFQQLWNPCAVAGGSGAVIPNDMTLGDRHAQLQRRLLLLVSTGGGRVILVAQLQGLSVMQSPPLTQAAVTGSAAALVLSALHKAAP